jgi:hypothetical protein
MCDPLGDASACPTGWTSTPCFSAGSTVPGCRPPPCVPAAPYCYPLPADCAAGLACTCLPNDICSHADAGQYGGQCVMITGRDVSCGAA